MSSQYRLIKPWYSGAKGERRESPTYHVRFCDHLDRWQDYTATSQLRTTEAIAQHLMELVEARRRGRSVDSRTQRWVDTLSAARRKKVESMDLVDARSVAADKPLLQHLNGMSDADGRLLEPGFEQELSSRGNDTKHINVTCGRIKSVLDGCGIVFWRDLNAPGTTTRIQLYLAKRRERGEIGGKSYNYYVRDIKSFCRWMHESDRAPTVALLKLKSVKNAEMDSKQRRALTTDEMRVLLPFVEASGEAWEMGGPDRALLYRFAFETGLRPKQIAHLTVADFDLANERGTVTSAAKYVKRRRQHTQLLTVAMTTILRERFSSKLAGAAAFHTPRRF